MEPSSPERVSHLTRATAWGVAWTLGGQFGTQALRFVLGVALARILVPEEFGLIAMIGVFTGFAAAIADTGLSAALVQRPDLRDEHLETAYWLNLVVGVGLTALTLAAALPIARFFREPRLVQLTMAIAPAFVLHALSMVHRALLTRAMHFRRLVSIEVVTTFVGGGSAIALALLGFGVWSLVAQTLVQAAVAAVGFMMLSSWRPSASFRREAARELWRFSTPLTGFTVLNYWSRSADNLLVGRFLGAAALGIYGRAYTLMLLPLTQVTHVVGRVMFPALSRLQEDPNRLARAYIRSVRSIALVTLPAMIGLFATADPFIEAVYGPKWRDVTPVLQVLAFVGLVQSIAAASGWLFRALGKTTMMFKLSAAKFVTVLAAFAIGLRWGTVGVAIAYLVHVAVWTVPTVELAGRPVGAGFARTVRAVLPSLLASFAMLGVVSSIGAVASTELGPTTTLVAQVLTGVLVYGALIWHTDAAREARELLRDVMSGRSGFASKRSSSPGS